MTTPDPKVERALRAFFEATGYGKWIKEPAYEPGAPKFHEMWEPMDVYREGIAAALKAAEEPVPADFTLQWCKNNPEAAARILNALAWRLRELDKETVA